MKRTRLRPRFNSIQTQVSSSGCPGASVEGRGREAVPLDTPHSPLACRNTYERGSNCAKAIRRNAMSAKFRQERHLYSQGASKELDKRIGAPRCYKYVAPDGAFALGASPGGTSDSSPAFQGLVFTRIFSPVLSVPLSGERQSSPRGSAWEALRACLRRQRRRSYQPRATPWVYQPKAILSAESAIHCAEGLSDLRLSRSDPMNPMRQAVGLRQNKTARKPRALPWAIVKCPSGTTLRRTHSVSGELRPRFISEPKSKGRVSTGKGRHLVPLTPDTRHPCLDAFEPRSNIVQLKCAIQPARSRDDA